MMCIAGVAGTFAAPAGGAMAVAWVGMRFLEEYGIGVGKGELV